MPSPASRPLASLCSRVACGHSVFLAYLAPTPSCRSPPSVPTHSLFLARIFLFLARLPPPSFPRYHPLSVFRFPNSSRITPHSSPLGSRLSPLYSTPILSSFSSLLPQVVHNRASPRIIFPRPPPCHHRPPLRSPVSDRAPARPGVWTTSHRSSRRKSGRTADSGSSCASGRSVWLPQAAEPCDQFLRTRTQSVAHDRSWHWRRAGGCTHGRTDSDRAEGPSTVWLDAGRRRGETNREAVQCS